MISHSMVSGCAPSAPFVVAQRLTSAVSNGKRERRDGLPPSLREDGAPKVVTETGAGRTGTRAFGAKAVGIEEGKAL